MSTANVNPTGLVSNEPVVVGHAVLWLLLNLGGFIVGHTHLVTAAQWSGVTTFLVPVITAFVLSVSAVVMRKYVTPFWKSLLKESGKLGVDPSLLTGDTHVQALFADLGLDSNGNPLPIPPVNKSPEAAAAQPGPANNPPA